MLKKLGQILVMSAAANFVGTIAHARDVEWQLQSWNELGDANWQIETDTASADSGNGFLVTQRTFSNFRLKVDFYAEDNTNSGVFLRCQNEEAINDKNCYEVNIFDSRPDPSGRTGSIVNVAPPKAWIDTENRWNTYEIIAEGSHLKVILNGVTTVDVDDKSFVDGKIALQFAQGGIRFRNFSIEETNSGSFEDNIVGVWQLTSFKLDDGKGEVKDWCEGAHGTIMYYQEYMSVAINCSSDDEMKVLYSGPYHLEEDVVVHDVQNYSGEGLKQKFRRTVRMDTRDNLDLVGPFGDGGEVIVSWKRLNHK